MSFWQDQIHLLGDYLKISLLNGHSRRQAAIIFFQNLENFLKLLMFKVKCTLFTHVMQLAGKNISAIFLGMKNTF